MMRQPLQIIRDIEREKADAGIRPTSATMNEVRQALIKEMTEELRQMCRNNILRWNRTINDISFYENKEDTQ